jgi:hypothetical protein
LSSRSARTLGFDHAPAKPETRRRGYAKTGALLLAIVGVATLPQTANAAPPFVERRQTLPGGNVSFDGAFGIGHYNTGPGSEGVGPGASLDIGFGLKQYFELGFGLGMRFGNDGQFAAADNYARLSDYRTFGVDGYPAFTPEVRFRSQIVDAPWFELSLDLRAGISVNDVPPRAGGDGKTRPAVRGGVPVSFHILKYVRIDSGAFVRLVFADDTRSGLLFPAEVWVQPIPKFWFGPHAGLLLSKPARDLYREPSESIQLGMIVGYSVASSVDLKANFMFPQIDDGTTAWGAGVGVQLRVE